VRARRTSSRLLVAATVAALTVVGLQGSAQAAVPDSPTGLTPSSGSSVAGIPTLTWTRSDGATSYDVQVSASASFSTVAWSTTSTVNSQAVPTAQVPQGLDYWRVRAKNSSGSSAWSVESFTRDPVSAPTLLSPLGDTLKLPENPPVLSWSPVSGATSYTVQVSTDQTFADTNAITSFSTKITSLVVSTLQIPNTYYWRVRAALGTGLNTAYSLPGSYVLQGLTPPTLVGPTPNSPTTNVQDVVLHWSAVPGAASYDVQVSTDSGFNTFAATQNAVVGTTYSPPITLNNDQYYWRARPVDASGNKLDWSQVSVWQFRRNWPDQPSLQYPADGATVGDPFYYQWTPVHHASHYQLQVSTSSSFPEDSRTSYCVTVGTTLVPGQNENNSEAMPCMPGAATTYYWRVMALDGPRVPPVQSDVISAQVHTFTYSPTMVNQTSPVDGASSVQVPTMRWDPVAGSAQYKLTYTDTTSGNSTTVTTASLSYTPRSLLTVGHTYRWQVQTVTGSGQVGASLLAGSQPTFTVVAQDPPVASVPAPTNSPSGQRFPTLTWSPVVNATKYQLYVRPSGTTGYTQVGSTFAYPAGEDTGTAWLTPGSYDWIVEAYNGTTLLSTTSGHGTFTITAMAAATNGRAALTGNQITGNNGTSVDSCAATLPNECQNLRQTPVLTWDPDPNAGFYKLYISHDGEMTNLLSGYNPITVYGNMWADLNALPDSQAGSAYFWEAVPCQASGACAPLAHASLAFNKLSNRIVLHPALANNPDTCATPGDVCNDVVLSWSDYLDTEQSASTTDTVLKNSAATTEARSYHVQTSTDPNFQTTLDDVTVDQTTFTSFGNTYPEGPVYWRVQAIDGSGNGLAWSDTTDYSFTKTSPSPTLTSPASGATQSGTQAFTWAPEQFAKSYSLEIYTNNDHVGQAANRVVSATGVLQAAYTPTTPLPVTSTPYTWRVRRVDAKGRTGPWSDLQDFTVTGATPTLTSPAEGAQVPPSDGLFAWQEVASAATYKFERRALGSSTVAQTATTAATAYAPTAAIAGGDWQWRVTALDASGQVIGSSDWRDFIVTDTVQATTAVTIDGSGAVGTVLTAQPPTWDPAGATTTYQWKRGTSTISGATNDLYTVTTADVGKSLTVVAKGTLAGYKAGTSTSNAIMGSAGPAPIPSVPPSITGIARYGQTLTANHGTWPGTVTKYAYQWLRNGSPISGATGTTHKVVAADAGHKVSVRVTVTETGLLPGQATSAAVNVAKLTSTTKVSLASSSIKKGTHGSVTMTVSGPGISKPTGKLRVYDGTRLLGTVALKASNSGRRTWRLPLLAKGKHHIHAKYSGSTTVRASASTSVTLKVV
jgi:large repetitive protein